MSVSLNQCELSNIEHQLISWTYTNEKTKEIKTYIDGVEIEIVLDKAKWIYPVPNCTLPMMVDHTMNISTLDAKVEKVFRDYFHKVDDEKRSNLYCTSAKKYVDIENYREFELRFFKNRQDIENSIKAEEKKYAPYLSPRWGIRYICNLC